MKKTTSYTSLLFLISAFLLSPPLYSDDDGEYAFDNEPSFPHEIIPGVDLIGYPLNHPSSQHHIAKVSAQGTIIELENGTQWRVKDNTVDAKRALSWSSDDKIIISYLDGNCETQNRRCSPYALGNLSDSEIIIVTLIPGVSHHDNTTLKITSISSAEEHTGLTLNDGSIWEVDKELSWSVGDIVTLGTERAKWLLFTSIPVDYYIINIDRDLCTKADLITP